MYTCICFEYVIFQLLHLGKIEGTNFIRRTRSIDSVLAHNLLSDQTQPKTASLSKFVYIHSQDFPDGGLILDEFAGEWDGFYFTNNICMELALLY